MGESHGVPILDKEQQANDEYSDWENLPFPRMNPWLSVHHKVALKPYPHKQQKWNSQVLFMYLSIHIHYI